MISWNTILSFAHSAFVSSFTLILSFCSIEQLFKLAAENTKRLLPPVVKSMNDVMRDIFMKDGMPPEIADMMLGEMPPEQQMYVISNNKGINGAVSMLYEDGLHELAEKLGSDLYHRSLI